MNQTLKQAEKDDVVRVEQVLEIKAPPEKVFEGLIKHLCDMEGEPGKPRLTLKLERKPGGRWYRDLGSDTGHLWGFVQSIKPPTLLEIFGPLMLSYPVATHMIMRLSPVEGGTKLVFKNEVLGPVPDDFREGMGEGWGQMLEAMKRDVEG
jgi:uncharacterized protein YndB with AHSA1/START domain